MAKSRSELLLQGAQSELGGEILRSAQNDMRSADGFAEGKRRMPGPGKS